jgi:hypothetical protein
MISDKAPINTKVEYRPFEDCDKKDRVRGTIVGEVVDDCYPVIMDWQRRYDSPKPKLLSRYQLYLVN